VLIVATGPLVVATSPAIHTPALTLWAILAVSLTTAATAVFVAGLKWWHELQDAIPVKASRVAPLVLTLAGAGVLVTFAPYAFMADQSWRGPALVSASIVGAVPVSLVLVGIRAALIPGRPSTNAAALSELLRLRSLAQRQLAALGSLVALATLALGASLRAIGDSAGPPETIFVFGFSCSVAVALIYLPARTALRRASENLIDAMFPLTDDASSDALLEVAEQRRALAKVVGVDGDLVGDLNANIAILAPLIAGAIDLVL
jgi:hypothetical protein